MRKQRKTALSSQGSSCQGHFLGIQVSDARSSETVSFLDRWLVKTLLSAIGNPPVSFVLWNDEVMSPDNVTPGGKLRIRSRNALVRLMINPELSFGDLYCSSQLEVIGDLPLFLHNVYVARSKSGDSLILKLFPALSGYHRRGNSMRRSRENIHHHYDIGNEFYSLWLDKSAMQYTCAYFPDPEMSLEQAQTAKLHHICKKLQLQPGQSVIEAGCGWGGLACFMAREYGVEVTAYNISREQIEYARRVAAQQGLSDRVTFVEDDYRNINGRYDVFVSIGMLEHVGIDHYKALGKLIDRCLEEDGIGLIHTIGRNKPALMNAWIEARIFPGGCPPSLGQMMDIFEPYSFSILDVENLRMHYAKTLQHWLRRFEGNKDAVIRMYDEVFERAWRLYLSGSIAAFTAGQLQLFQVLFTRQHNNHLPWSRAHLYDDLSHRIQGKAQ